MARKAPRRTAERILEVTLDLFNRFGEPNVSTTLISAEMNISPGNLYYHYPAKDELINSLYDRYEHSLTELLNAAEGVRNVEDAVGIRSRLLEPVEILEVAAAHLRAERGQCRRCRVRSGQAGDLVPGGDKLTDDVRTGMAGPAGDENAHAACPCD